MENIEKFKLTNQRLVILDFLKENFTHPSVDEIYLEVKKKLPRISKKTVYLNLQFLTNKGLIQEINVLGVKRFEPKLQFHHHLICLKCFKIYDIKSKELYDYTNNFAKNIDDFDVEYFNINFFGICNKCKNR